MSDIRITPIAQLAIMAALFAAVTAAIGAQLPEIRRYLRVRSMD